jgi:hypothetical protein
MRKSFGLAVALAATVGLVAVVAQTGGAAEPVTVKQVMKEAMKDGLCKKVGAGQASDAEVKQLLQLFTDMAKQPAPSGDAASWKAKCEALVAATQDVAAGKPGATDQLKKAANCKACHDVHKGQ